MNKKRKKIINIIIIFIIIGGLALAGFSPVFVDMLKKASAQNEGEMGDNVAITEDVNTEVTESTEMSYDTLEVEDTIYAVSMGEGEGHIQLSSVTSVSDLVVGKNYMVETYEDWQKIYNFSQVSTLKDITFWLYYPGQSTESKTWELTSEHIKNGIGSKEYPFSGTIKPFYTDMTIKTSAPLFAYLSSDAVIGNAGHNNNPMTITNEIVSMGEGIGAGGLATNYVMKSGETVYLSGENSKFKNLKITGNITNVKGTVGGLFGNVILEDGLEGNDEGTEASTDASAEIILDSDSISIEGMKEVSGYIAGGLFGEVSGNITMTLNSMPSVAAKVYGYYDGYNTGKAGYYYDGMISQMKVCAGGLIGKMTNEAVLQTNNSESSAESEEETYLTINNLVMSDSISGGIVGAVQNSTVKLCYVEKDSEDVEHLDAEPYLWARYIGGGFIGLADSSKIELDNLKLGVDIKVCYTGTRIKSSAGGIIGRYITDESDTESYLRISNLCTENTQRLDTGDKVDTTQRIFVLEKTDTHNNNCGGIIGSCNGNNVRINKIELTPEKYNVSLNYMIWTEGIPYQKGSKCNNYSYAASGAIAGSMAGLSIEISDIIFDLRHNSGGGCEYSNGIAGYYIGDIAGQVGLDRSVVYENNADVISDISVPTKMKVSDITVKNSCVFTAQKYQGGLFGYVGKGAIICLSDNINLSQIPFQTFIGSDASKVNAWGIYIMLAPSINGGSRGLIAGYAEESLIYFEEGAIVTRSITQTEGEIVSNMIEVGNAYVPFDPNNGTYYEYVIDDIGNAGSVFQNFSENGTKIIDYSQAYGKEVTGTIDKNAEGKYVIDSLGDALRLAIVGQTYDMSTGNLTFAANCFADDTSISDILSANYLITTDLNLGATNIQSFLRSDATLNGSVLGFSGSMEGQNTSNTSPTITMNSISRHKNGGLYPLLQSASNDAVSFKNLTIDGYMYYHLGSYNTTTKKSEGGSGSIAARAIGNCSFENMTIKTKIKGDMYDTIFDDTKMYSHGGLIGEYQLNGGTLSVTGCEFSPEITTIRSSNFAGGMIGRIYTSTELGKINISNCTVGTKITADSNFMQLKSSDKTNKFHARAAGLISFIGNDYAKVSSISNDWVKFYPGTVEDETYAEITINDIDLKNASIDLSKVSSTSVNISGGLLGYAWCNVEVTMKNVNVGTKEASDEADKCVINSLGYVGGLVSFIAGKGDLSDIALNQLAMTSVDIGRSYCSFLFGNGECAYITIDQATYDIDTNNVTIKDYSENFDEIVGSNIPWTFNNDNNKEFNATIITGYRDGGIVNIVNTYFSNFKSEEGKNAYQSYINRVCTTTNQYTRYYYNLFSDNDSNSWNIDSDMNNLNINTPQKLMTWHVGNYANSNLTHFFKAYFGGNDSYRDVKNITLSGKLDMNGYSLYPTSVDGVTMSGSNAEVILYGAEISDLEENLKSGGSNLVYRNNDLVTYADSTYSYVKTQHYMMHSSLLYCVTDAAISDLKMSGTIANNCQDSGSLIGGYSLGSISISGIVFNGLKVSNYDKVFNVDEQSSSALMLARVGFMANGTSVSTSANISDISMVGYENGDVGIAASALVSQAGNSASKDVQITFKNMKLMYEKASSPFKYATFLYRFEYSSDSKDNKSYGIYTFNYEDTVDATCKKDNHNVTYGSEIINGLHYDDMYLSEVTAEKDNPLKDAIIIANNYLPYTATNNKDIYVNPKSGDITKGCGTYEDPYIIENVSQFMTLFCYLTGEHDTYQFFLKPGNSKWKVVPIGGDGDAYECNKNHKEIASYGDENFPTVDEMRTAYYMITEDIDLVGGADMNYAALVKRFSGLGSYKYPFAGVIVGSANSEGKYPTITIPGAGDWTNYSNLGLIEYMQGAVVKDINIKNNSWPMVTNSAGGVAAVILGGDNIIDNVKVSIEVKINNATTGGYVGTIENGSLILRNIKNKNVVEGCKFYKHTITANDNYSYTQAALSAYKNTVLAPNTKVGLLVGTVKDGYVLYDGSEFGSTAKVLTNDDVNVTGVVEEVSPLINGFELINGAALDKGGKIFVFDDDTNAYLKTIDINFWFGIYSAEQLEILSLALNSDSLSVYIDTGHSDADNRTEHLSGYDYTAKCRKATYGNVGAENARSSDDCIFAKAYDDGWIASDTEVISTEGDDIETTTTKMNYYAYPYLCYKYMNFNNSNWVYNDDNTNYAQFKKTIYSDEVGTKFISKINKADDNVSGFTTFYQLNNGEKLYVYDLSDYKNSFRGIGALYSKEYSDFRGNFDGNGYSVKIRMERDWDSTLAITGMFNSLTYHNKDDVGANKYLSIQNLTIVDSAFENIMNTETMVSVKSTNELQGTSCGAATGALAGEIEGAWYINNVTFKRTEAAQPTETVSLLAALSDEDYTKELVCGVRGYMNVGGLIGRVNVTGTDTVYGSESVHNKSNDIMLVNCNIEGYSTDKAVNIQAGSDSFAAGGLIGSIGANINTKNHYWNPVTYFYFGKVSFVSCSVTNANILAKNSGFLGGFAGTVGYRHASYYRSVGSVNVLYAKENLTTIYNKLTNVKIISENETEGDEYDKYSAGGVFGQVDVLATKPLEADSDGTTYRNVNIGSITDECTLNCINLDNVTVNIHSTNYNESSSTYNDSMQRNGIGGLVGYVNCRKMSIYDATVANSNIGVDGDVYAKTNVGGLIGYSSSCSEGNNTKTCGFYTNFLAASVVEVKNSKIMCDQPCASAGGFIGYLSTDVVSMWASYDDGSLLFSKSEGNTISSKGTDSHAGGVIGNAVTSPYKPLEDSRATSSFKSQHWLYHIDVLKNYITSADGYAGGMIGNYAGANYIYGNMYLGYIRVGNQEDYAGINQNGETIAGDVSNQIVGSVYAGGLCGFTHQWTGFVYSAPIRIGTINANNYYNTISAKVSGGLFGRHSSNYEYFQTDEIEICQNRIAATSKNQIAYGYYTVSGGACGIREYVLADSIKATYKIKENVIIATGRAGETADKICEFSCGGIYGKSIYTGGNTLQYFDDIVLSNNSIGYYPLTTTSKNDMTAIVEEIKKLTNKSQEVCLLKRSSSGFTYGNWRTFNINESNVGDYSDRIGNFFGEYVNGESSVLHCMILRPTVEYSNEIGSIPAIDVGQLKDTYRETVSPAEYGLAYPYAYRSKCHIIYLDDYAEGNIVDISSSENGVIPTLSTDVLMEHGTTIVTTTNGDGTTSENEVPVYETEYFFGGIEQIVSKYEAVKNSETTDSESGSETVSVQATYAFLTSKRLDISLGGNENSNLICASPDEDDYFESTYVNDKEQYNGVPVIEVDGQSVQYIGDYVAEILTNGGGVCKDSNTFKNFLTISSVNAYIDPDGTIYAIDGDGKVGSTEETHKPSIVVTDNEISSEDCPYDVVIEIDGKKYYTISLLCYTYHSYNYDRTEKKETIYIPVFVTKKVTVNSYLSILEGEEYSLEQAAVNGYNNAVISHDSTYTVYAEFVYDDVRKEDGFKDIKMEKTLVFETNKGDGYAPINMQSGTKYTLIDVQTGKEYYYEVPEGGVSQIPFSYFLDADGNSYSQRNIGDEITTTKTDYKSITHKDSEDTPDSFEGEVGLEQFFMVVRPSGKDNNMSFRLSIDAKAVDANNENKEELVRKFLTEGVNITNIFGPLIGFEGVSVTDNVLSGTEGVTEITGKISREETLTVDGRIRISVVPESNPNSERGGSPYWVNKANGNTIDSSNTGKYLEIGVTLIDEDGQEVQWPEGTNVIMNGGSPKPLQGNSVIYTYKDNGETFAFDTLSHDIANGVWYYYNVSSDDNTPEYRWITYDSNGKWYYKEYQRGANGNLILSTVKLEDSFVFDNDKVIVSNQCHLEFDFSVADIKDYAGKSYTVRINLYRSSDPEFPLEEAGVAVADGSIREYAKTIFAEGAADLAAAITPDNLLDLGINLYQNDQTTHEISFSNKLDFTDLISDKEPKLSADVDECAAQKYMVTYRIYKKTLISDGNGYQYELVNLNDANSPFTLYQVDGNSENQTETVIPIKEITMADGTIEYAFVASQNFTTDEIKAGTDGKTAYVTSWNMKLKLDSKKMTDSDLANYKIEATYLPYSQDEIPENDEESTLKDYFIFTIAKLKTDF